MRARNLKTGLFKNELLGTADPLLTILFEGLWCLADREGRLEDRPLRIKAEIFPYRDGIDLDVCLGQLAEMGFIHRYEAEGVAVIEVTNFKKHQNPHPKEAVSSLPDCGRVKVVSSRVKVVSSPADVLNPDVLNPTSSSSRLQLDDDVGRVIRAFEQSPVTSGKAKVSDWSIARQLLETWSLEQIEYVILLASARRLASEIPGEVASMAYFSEALQEPDVVKDCSASYTDYLRSVIARKVESVPDQAQNFTKNQALTAARGNGNMDVHYLFIRFRKDVG